MYRKNVSKWHLEPWSLRLLSSVALYGATSVFGNPILAQVTPDGTLEIEQSIVNSSTNNGSLRQQVEGGAIRGINLFHSFRDFNIAEGQSLYFQSPIGIQNIISRVTGRNPSNLEGTLGVSGGSANLFLLNPNGIIFGANARLDVRGSFVATTANAIQFGTQGFFSSSTPGAPPLLTVNPSAFLFNQIAPAPIVNRSTAPLDSNNSSLDPNRQGLQVPDGESLLVLGGEVNLVGGGVNTAGGRVELGAVAGTGKVGLSLDNNDLRLEFPAILDRADIILTNGATVDTSGEGGGSIQIWGKRVLVNDGSKIAAFTQGAKPGGDLIVNASESVELIGFSPPGNLSTLTSGDGKAGDLTIDTRKLIVRDGAQVLSSTLDNGSAGQLTVNASESVELKGLPSLDFLIITGLGSFTAGGGDAGKLTINTTSLIVRNATLSTESLSISDENGQQFIPASGQGGNLTINASGSVELSNRGFLYTITQGSGNAGNLTINTNKLLVQDSSEINTRSIGVGNAGNITVRAQSTVLNNQSILNATTTTSQGGNVTLRVQDVLLLRRGSSISTTAGTAQAGGNGGNITIDGKLIVAVPRENSNITANAFLGRGGNVRITTQGIFGIEPRFQETPLSDITASSEFGISGTITLNTPDVDPSRGLVTLPTDLQDTSSLIASTCPADEGNSFAITGRGGLPDDPRQPLMGERVWLDDRGQSSALNPQSVPAIAPQASKEIIEAQGWIRNQDGSISLVATYPSSMTQAFRPVLCSAPSK
ncbi:filamentous hemagglutinin N-terminal domain-containing protein [Cyanobacteria bacterium FACHB-63]|nr:filamentous hemagglutinin N-terminal domain-containing protein [Cyanobacteria bacterium FACHB-63]